MDEVDTLFGNRPIGTALLVLGMHRSGTSAFTGLLNKLGVELGSSLLPPKSDNPKGFFEHPEIVELHDLVLSVFGASWDDPRPLPADWVHDPRLNSVREKLVALIRRDFSGKRLWAVKDPRLCRLVPFWLPVLEDLNITAKAVIVMRNPGEVAASLNKRDRIPLEQSLMLWLSHYVAAERDSRGLHRSIVLYEDILRDWQGSTHRLRCDLRIDLSALSDEVVEDISDFLETDLRHHHEGVTARLSAPQNQYVQAVYDAMIGWGRDGVEPGPVCDKAERVLFQARDTAAPIISYIRRKARDELGAKEQALAAKDQVLAAKDRALAAASAELSAVRSQQEQAARAAADQEASLRRQLEAVNRALAAACSEQERAARMAAEQEISLHERLDVMRRELTAMERARDDAIRQLEAHRQATAEYVASLQAQLIAFQTSSIWQLTAPVRKVLHSSRMLHSASRRALRVVLEAMPLRKPQLKKQHLHEASALIATGAFDPAWYLQNNSDVRDARVDPILHYINHGRAEGREPRAPGNAPQAALRPDPSPLPAHPPAMDVTIPQAAELIRERFHQLEPLPTYIAPHISKTLTLVTDSINAGSLFGGVATSVILAALICNRLECALRVVTRTEPADPESIPRVLAANQVEWSGNVEFQFVPPGTTSGVAIGSEDLFLTTSWWTTAAVRQAVQSRKIIALVQEDERMFYPHGDDRLRCYEVLCDPRIRMVVNSRILFEHLKQPPEPIAGLEDRAIYFEPAVPKLHRLTDVRTAQRNFFFYARPNNLRNLYWRGLEVINAALEEGLLIPPHWNFFFVGKDLRPIQLACGVHPHLLQNLPWSEYQELVGQMDLALCLMDTPHPSYPPLDLAAAGAVVVTNRWGPKVGLDQYSPNIVCVPSSVEGLLSGLREGAARCGSVQKQAAALSSGVHRDWGSALEPVLDFILGEGF